MTWSAGLYASGRGVTRAGSRSAAPVIVTPPGPPTGVVADNPGDRRARVSWNPPSDRGGGTIQSYTVTASVNGNATGTTTVDGGTTRVTITGLQNGTSYRFNVFATNEDCDGLPSAHSNAVTPTQPEPPSGPSGPSDPSDPSNPSSP